MSDEWVTAMLCGIFIGAMLMGGAFIIAQYNAVVISQDTANDICHNLTGNSASTASNKDFKLVCEIPSFDHTTNIIIKNNGDGE